MDITLHKLDKIIELLEEIKKQGELQAPYMVYPTWPLYYYPPQEPYVTFAGATV